MKLMGKGGRPRNQRRADERQLRKAVRTREKLATAAPGGGADRPIAVSTAALVEPTARATPCPQCGGTLDLQSDRVTPGAGGELLRALQLVCRLCHTPRTLWFVVRSPALN